MKICIVCSPGGHLTEANAILEAFNNEEYFLIVQKFPIIKDSKFNDLGFKKIYKLKILFEYGIKLKIFGRDIFRLGAYLSIILNFFEILFIFLKEKPDIIFSTGAEIGLIASYIGKFLFGAKIIFLESLTRIKDISMTGKILMPIADLFLVQWQELEDKYKGKVLYKGKLI